MKNGAAAIVGGLAIFGALVLRRVLKLRAAINKLECLARNNRFHSSPSGFFRVAITGVSRGIGSACVDLLRAYPSIEIVSLGRSRSMNNGIFLDLTDEDSVMSAIGELGDKWYNNEKELVPGRDILVNNAGVFYAPSASMVWRVNLTSPSVMTHILSSKIQAMKSNPRSLRFVQVTSRLEKRSLINSHNVSECMDHGLDSRDGCFSPQDVYADTKRVLVLLTAHMASLNEKRNDLTFVAVTPGMVNTDLGRNGVWRLVWWMSYPLRFILLRHPIEGAVSVLWAAFASPDQSGVYFGDSGEILERIRETRDLEAGRRAMGKLLERFNVV